MYGALGKASRWTGHRARAVSSRKLKHQKDSCSLQEQKKVSRRKTGATRQTSKRAVTLYAVPCTVCGVDVGVDICCKRRDQESAGRVRLPGAAVFVSFRFHNHKARRVHPAASCAGLLFHLGRQLDSRAPPQRRRHRVGVAGGTPIPSRNWNVRSVRTWPLRAGSAIPPVACPLEPFPAWLSVGKFTILTL